ncbi:CLUMA_CG013518, isoform A [Clunio marinus]|uniref:CLUMA_CG013518, isoform A n=1 Tax=Clunio marinus TaxID=568069 RepID=A0A1J1IJ30_9DIPT|nr:CLUMA_CG013518, isoform A [Clunio marinus]
MKNYEIKLIKTLNMQNFMVSVQQEQDIINKSSFPIHQHNNFIVLDLSCENSKQLLNELTPNEFFQRKFILLDTQSKINLQKYLEFKAILPSSEIFYFENDVGNIFVKQVYRTSLESSTNIETFGLWFKGNDAFKDLRSTTVTSRRRNDLYGTELRASIVVTNNDTLHHLDDYHDKHIDTISKVNYQLTNRLIEWLNATISYSIVTSWGYKNNETNEWSGMIGELEKKIADLGASPLFFTADRVDVIDYIACTSQTKSKFVFRSPKLSYTDNVFVLPFDSGVWKSLGAMLMISSFILYFASSTEWKSNLVNVNDPTILKPSMYETSFVLFCALCQQGSSSLPISFGSRLITMICFTALMFLYASYSANIVALLQSPSSKIKTLEDLYNSRIKLGVDDTVFNHYYFAHADEKIRKAIYNDRIKRKDGKENFYNLSDGVKMIREDLFGFHMEVGVGYKILLEEFQEDEKCGLQEIQYLQVIDPFYAIQKNSSYYELFKIGLLKLHEFGLQDRENSRLYTRKPKCSGQGSKFISVGLIDVQPALLIFLYGIGAGFMALFIEKFHFRFKSLVKN